MLRAFQWDLARQVERLDHLLALLPRYAAWGYQRLYLHLEDAVDYPSLPGVARADAYTWGEFSQLVAAATAHGIAVVPIANLLGHTQYLIKTPEWRDLNELRDPTTGDALPVGQICPLHPRLPELVSRLFADLAPLCTAGEIHCGLDESFHLGKHPLSRAEVAEIGLPAHFARHVLRLRQAAALHGLRLGLWADMLALLPEAIPLLAEPSTPHPLLSPDAQDFPRHAPPPSTPNFPSHVHPPSPRLPAPNSPQPHAPPPHNSPPPAPPNSPRPAPQKPSVLTQAKCNQIGYTSRPATAGNTPSTRNQIGYTSGPSSASSLPALVAYDWYYHPFARLPRLELRHFAPYDLAPALAAAGIAYWACPMNGAFRHEFAPVWTDRLQNITAWWHRAHATQATGYLVTSWEPYRLALPTTTLMDAAAATLWLDPAAPDDPASLLAAGLRRYTAPTALCNQIDYTSPAPAAASAHVNRPLNLPAARSLARRLLATDTLAFCGNSRWEINRAWTPVAGRRDSPTPHAAAARQLTRLATIPVLSDRASPLAPLAATLRFQSYLAQREVFVRRAATLIHRLRRAITRSPNSKNITALITTLTEHHVVFVDQLQLARSAARSMWIASRPADSFPTSQNAALLAADSARLRSLRRWIRSVSRRPQHAFRASPVAARWTLRLTLHHFAPCHQKIVIEQQQPDGTWHELYARVLIEFRAVAAQPHTPRLRFEIAVPIDAPAAPLRIASRCLGEFAVSHIDLTDGVTTRQHRPFRTRHTLGIPAPATGWPPIDWATNTAVLNLQLT